MGNAAVGFFRLGPEFSNVVSLGMDLVALGRRTAFAALEQHAKRKVTIGGSVEESCFACRTVNLVHWDGDLASAIGGINDFHVLNFGLHYNHCDVFSFVGRKDSVVTW